MEQFGAVPTALGHLLRVHQAQDGLGRDHLEDVIWTRWVPGPGLRLAKALTEKLQENTKQYTRLHVGNVSI